MIESTAQKPSRSKRLTINLSAEEYKPLQQKAKYIGQPISVYARACLFNVKLKI
jgi:hypothetical protein